MQVPLWVWALTIAAITLIIGADLVLASRRPHQMRMRETTLWVLLYVGLAAVFAVGVWVFDGSASGQAFVAGYVTEYSLSVDNLFVFVLILSRFAVPALHQHKILLIGIALSLVLRGLCIVAGAAAINAFQWVFYLFGAILFYTAVRLVIDRDSEPADFHSGRTVRLLQRLLPSTADYHGSRLTAVVDGRRMLTPMVVVVATIGVANVIFALDSIPAIFGLTQEAFLVFTANAFALMGLRQLYFLVSGLLDRLQYLSYGLAAILAFIAVKLVLEALEGSHVSTIAGIHLPHIGIAASLGFIVIALATTTAASLVGARLKTNAREESRV